MADKATSSVTCSICQITFNSTAELAIHEFSKRHCDNLLRTSRNQPVKQKTAKPVQPPPPPPPPDKTATAVIEPSPVVNLSLYGYFDGTQTVEKPKDFNTEYDPYLQKLAENPFKEQLITPTTNVKSFTTSKRKKKRMCAICNVDCLNIPDYDAHMKSPQHIWKLKMSGMGVSAHFVKAGTDLHTTDRIDAEENEGDSAPEASSGTPSSSVPVAPGELYCDTCHLQLNSQYQYQAHVAGKAHNDLLKRAQKKTVVHKPVPNQLFCYSCMLPLTDLSQFSAHKKGKKHHIKCRQLIKEGFTIPPEERPDDMPWSGPRKNAVIRYPDLYQQFIDKQNDAMASKLMPPPPTTVMPSSGASIIGPVQPQTAPTPAPLPEINSITGMYHCPHCSDRFATSSKLEIHIKTHKTGTSLNGTTTNAATAAVVQVTIPAPSTSAAPPPAAKKPTVLEGNGFACSVCKLNYTHQPPYEMHLNSEEHALKILEVKKSGTSSKALLDMLMADRKVIRGDRYGKYCCGICAVISHTTAELEQHTKSVLHKYTEKDYSKKRMIEIQQSIVADSDGKYSCKLCKEDFTQLILFNTHLHSTEHRNLFWKEHVKKNYINRWLYTRPGTGFRYPYRTSQFQPKNPGVRTKIAGMAKNLTSGIVIPVPNLEQIEPKIDQAKNVRLNSSMAGNASRPVAVRKKLVSKKKTKAEPKARLRAVRKLPGMIYKLPLRGLPRLSPSPPPPPIRFVPESQPMPWYPEENRFERQLPPKGPYPREMHYDEGEGFYDRPLFPPERHFYEDDPLERPLPMPPRRPFPPDRFMPGGPMPRMQRPPLRYPPRMPLRPPYLAPRPRPPIRYAPYHMLPRNMPPRFPPRPRGWW